MKGRWPISAMCGVLEVSVSGYYDWHRRDNACAVNQQRVSDARLLVEIRAIHKSSFGEYGWPRVWHELQQNNIRVGKERVRLLMQHHGIQGRVKRKYIVTTDSAHGLSVAPDRLKRQFEPAAPNTVWASDITYLPTDEGWLYLAVVLDLFGRRVVGWSLRPHMQTELVKSALTMAWNRRQPAPGLILHSDRGSQYCSREFQQTLTAMEGVSSMSKKGDCWDNSPVESFWSRLKAVCLPQRKFRTREEAFITVMEWITFYNHRRLHSSLGYLSPMRYEERWHNAQHKMAA